MVLNPSVLEAEIIEQSNLLRTDKLDISFGELMSLYERQEIVIKPAFQRYFRWNIDQRTRFIESLLLGIPIPPIFVASNEDGIWELVDGLQRVSTVLSFFGILRSEDEGIRSQNNWIMSEGDRVDSLEGFTGDTLPAKFRLNIRRTGCRVEILRWNSHYDLRFELFNRLNTGGSPLTSQEIRNCIYRDISAKFNDFLKELAQNSDFLEVISLPDEQYERLYHEELVLRFLSLYHNSHNLHTNLAQHMTSFMKNAVDNKNFDYDFYRKLFEKVFSLLKPLGDCVFRKTAKGLSTVLYDSITIGIAENIEKYAIISPETLLVKIDTYKNLQRWEALEKHNFRGGTIKERIETATKIFSEI